MADIFKMKRAVLDPDTRKKTDEMQKRLIKSENSEYPPACFGRWGDEKSGDCSNCWFREDCKVNTKDFAKIAKKRHSESHKRQTLELLEKKLVSIEKRLNDREKEIEKRENELNKREAALDKREEELTAIDEATELEVLKGTLAERNIEFPEGATLEELTALLEAAKEDK